MASTIPKRASRDVEPVANDDPPDSYYDIRPRTSSIRYRDTRGNQVIQQGNRRIIIHEQPPPKRRGVHWLVWVGIIMFLFIGVWLVNIVGIWLTNEQNNFTYGMPRTFQINAVVGHNDSLARESHFIALNLNGQVEVIEIPGGDPSKERVYLGPTIFSPDADLVPVTVSFEDVNGDGKPDMLIHIQGQTIVFLNTGTEFKPQQ
jgi:hypothetical protein